MRKKKNKKKRSKNNKNKNHKSKKKQKEEEREGKVDSWKEKGDIDLTDFFMKNYGIKSKQWNEINLSGTVKWAEKLQNKTKQNKKQKKNQNTKTNNKTSQWGITEKLQQVWRLQSKEHFVGHEQIRLLCIIYDLQVVIVEICYQFARTGQIDQYRRSKK